VRAVRLRKVESGAIARRRALGARIAERTAHGGLTGLSSSPNPGTMRVSGSDAGMPSCADLAQSRGRAIPTRRLCRSPAWDEREAAHGRSSVGSPCRSAGLRRTAPRTSCAARCAGCGSVGLAVPFEANRNPGQRQDSVSQPSRYRAACRLRPCSGFGSDLGQRPAFVAYGFPNAFRGTRPRVTFAQGPQTSAEIEPMHIGSACCRSGNDPCAGVLTHPRARE